MSPKVLYIVFSVLYFCLCIWANHFCSDVERAIHANFSIDTTKEFPLQLFTAQLNSTTQLPIILLMKQLSELSSKSFSDSNATCHSSVLQKMIWLLKSLLDQNLIVIVLLNHKFNGDFKSYIIFEGTQKLDVVLLILEWSESCIWKELVQFLLSDFVMARSTVLV
jgi:hypothetical protein